MAVNTSDVLILGGGTMGTAAAWALARRGYEVTVLEQFSHVHGMGSHGGKTRIFRHAYAEGALYVPWTLQADRLWTELEERTASTILHRVGCVDISAPGFHRAREARSSAEAYGLAHEWLTGADVNARWPIWNLPVDREVCYGPDAGFLDIAAALGAMRRELEEAGGSIREQTVVTGWSANEHGVEVETADGRFTADRLVIAAGAWSSHILAGVGIPLEVRRKPVLWFELDPEHAASGEPDRMPVFISEEDQGEFYGIPHFDVPGIKVGMHSGGGADDARTIDRTVHDADIRDHIWPFIQRNMIGLTGEVTDTAVCMYTMTPDEDFVIDRHPGHDRVAFAAGFSGHGFKFAPVIGDYLAALITDAESGVVPDFALARFTNATAAR